MTANENKTDRQWLWTLGRGSRLHMLLSAVCTLLTVILSFSIPFVVSFLLDYVIQGLPVSLPQPLASLLEVLGGRTYLIQRLYLCALALVLLTLLNGLFTFLRRRETALSTENFTKNLRDRLYRHLEDVPYDYHKHASTGDLVQRCTSDVETVRRFVSLQLMEILRSIAMAVIAIWVMFSINTRMALLSTMFLPILLGSSTVYFHFVRRYFNDSDEAEGQLSAMLQENLTGMRVVRAFGQQRREIGRFTAINRAYRKKTLKLNNLLALYWGLSDMVGFSQIAISLCAGIYAVAKGGFTLGNVTLFVTYTSMLTWPIRQLGRILEDLGKATVSFKRLTDILNHPAEQEPGKALTPDLGGDVVFDRVCFGYDRPNDVLDDLSFTAHPGETVAILGSTGSGKTSLVQLLQRLYTVTGGAITLNGVNINQIDGKYLRRNIGIVMQEPFLYARSIRDNIRMASPQASMEEVYDAARQAAVHQVIESFDGGYDAVVGERGVSLSGGQRQRVAIARTLLQKARILIFDDSLSAVDAATDAKIRAALLKRRQDGVTFIISHRVSTLREADLILVLENGRIVERGSHESLMQENGLYRRIAGIQGLTEGGSAT